ncbi:hypothetical protein [Runella sp.]|uniref:hypothetical protein n=1 Tax=Runella sp. TaxID=1960881 RepID=UPI003D0B6724
MNKNSYYTALSFFLLFTITSCSSAPEKIGNLDLVKWRSDRGGCKDVRKGLEKEFVKVQNEFLGKHIDEVGYALGRPDIQQLASRDQKFYVYFLEKGVHCNDITQKSAAQKAILRFNAVGLLSEITFQARPL